MKPNPTSQKPNNPPRRRWPPHRRWPPFPPATLRHSDLVLGAVVAAFALFLLVTFLVLTTNVFEAVDARLLRYFTDFQAQAPDWLTTGSIWFQDLSSVVLGMVTAVLILYWLVTGYTRRFFLLLASAGGAELLWLALLFTIGRERPEPVTIFGGISLPSYPSGHAQFNVAFYGTLAYIFYGQIRSTWGRRVLLGVTALLLLLTGLNRLFFSVHYFSDLLGGYLMGVAWTAFALWLVDWLLVKLKIPAVRR